MQSVKRPGRPARTRQPVLEPVPEGVEPGLPADLDAAGPDGSSGEETAEIHRVVCPDCARPIAVFDDEDLLPEHALCATRFDPFGLQACPGTGRPVGETRPADSNLGAEGQDAFALLTLPQGLDWRTQPFSHAGRPGRQAAQAA